MQELIDEYLEENFEDIHFQIKFIRAGTYEIICEIMLKDKIIKTEFRYTWNAGFTNESNLTSIRMLINKTILKLFKKGDV